LVAQRLLAIIRIINLPVNDKIEFRLERIFPLLRAGFCLAYFLPGLISGKWVASSEVWFFERQIQWLPFTEFNYYCLKNGIYSAWSLPVI